MRREIGRTSGFSLASVGASRLSRLGVAVFVDQLRVLIYPKPSSLSGELYKENRIKRFRGQASSGRQCSPRRARWLAAYSKKALRIRSLPRTRHGSRKAHRDTAPTPATSRSRNNSTQVFSRG
jgi:hypothetical protein